MASPLVVIAGRQALQEIRDGGLDLRRVSALIGASGGPKFLALNGIDRVLFPRLRELRSAPLHVVGSSIGAWRFACLAQDDPAEALARLTDAYIEQWYPYPPTPSVPLVTRTSRRILDTVFGRPGLARIVEHPWLRTHIATVRARHLLAMVGRSRTLGLGGLALAAAVNAISRRGLGLVLERVLFDSHGEPGQIRWCDVPTRHVELTHDNAAAAMMATIAIPMVLEGVTDPVGAPPGLYLDGGVCDYHFGNEIDPDEGLVLYPHFYPELIPGWFDKALRWRRTRNLERTVIVAPSPEFVRSLPAGRIPDRTDFPNLDDEPRIRTWRTVVEAGSRLADAFVELLDGPKLRHNVAPLA